MKVRDAITRLFILLMIAVVEMKWQMNYGIMDMQIMNYDDYTSSNMLPVLLIKLLSTSFKRNQNFLFIN